jgi:hypothetical protein
MGRLRRQQISDLSLRDYCLYRAICIELEDLEETIHMEGTMGRDFLEISAAMRDRRLLVEWLRDLHYPPSCDFTENGISEEVEDQLLAQASD